MIDLIRLVCQILGFKFQRPNDCARKSVYVVGDTGETLQGELFGFVEGLVLVVCLKVQVLSGGVSDNACGVILRIFFCKIVSK